MIYQILKHAHSGLRWILLVFLILAILNSFYKLLLKSDYLKFDKIISIAGLSSVHLQFIIGLILYFISPVVIFKAESMSNSLLRFFLIEHAALMLLSVITITIGYRFVKKAAHSSRKHLNILLFYSIALLVILISIPWPWRIPGTGWF